VRAASDTAFNLTLSGTDETTGQVLMARHGYSSNACETTDAAGASQSSEQPRQ
jgi:hypothetical protein